MGSTGVFIGGTTPERLGDITAHGGNIVLGYFTVLIGETGSGGDVKAGSNSQPGSKQAKDNKNSKSLKEAAKTGGTWNNVQPAKSGEKNNLNKNQH